METIEYFNIAGTDTNGFQYCAVNTRKTIQRLTNSHLAQFFIAYNNLLVITEERSIRRSAWMFSGDMLHVAPDSGGFIDLYFAYAFFVVNGAVAYRSEIRNHRAYLRRRLYVGHGGAGKQNTNKADNVSFHSLMVAPL